MIRPRMDSRVVQAVIGMGYSRDHVKTAIINRLKVCFLSLTLQLSMKPLSHSLPWIIFMHLLLWNACWCWYPLVFYYKTCYTITVHSKMRGISGCGHHQCLFNSAWAVRCKQLLQYFAILEIRTVECKICYNKGNIKYPHTCYISEIWTWKQLTFWHFCTQYKQLFKLCHLYREFRNFVYNFSSEAEARLHTDRGFGSWCVGSEI